MPAGFLVTRLLLVCLLSEVEHNSIFATAHPPSSQGVRKPYDYHIQREGQLKNPHNPWAKILEGFRKNRQHPGANHQLGWPDQIQNPHEYLPQIHVQYPSDVVPSHNPDVDAKKMELNVNVPVQQLLKTLASVKGSEWFQNLREGDSFRVSPVFYQEEAGGPSWSEQTGSPKNKAKRKPNPGLNFRFTAPVPDRSDRRPNLQRPDLAYLSQSGPAEPLSPEFGLERAIMHLGQGPSPCFGPLGCPLVSQDQVNPSALQQQIQQRAQLEKLQQQILQQLPILSQILAAGHDSPSGGNNWMEGISKRLPQFHLSIKNTPVPGDYQQRKPVKAPESKKPQSSRVYPRMRCSPPPPPEARSSQGEQWVLCPQLFRGRIH